MPIVSYDMLLFFTMGLLIIVVYMVQTVNRLERRVKRLECRDQPEKSPTCKQSCCSDDRV